MITYLLNQLPLVKRLREQLLQTREAFRRELEKNMKRPARLTVIGLMSDLAIEENLAGTETNSVMRSVCAIINAKIVELSDLATDRPRQNMDRPEGSVEGYSMDERLHDAGGAAHLADLLAKLQELSKPKEQSAA